MLPVNTLEILKNLSKPDLKRLGDFVQSPYFNSKETLSILYKEIAKQYPDFNPAKFEYKKIYKKIYGNSEYKEQTIRNLYSEFGRLMKKFVAYERIESKEMEFNLALIKGLTDKKCYELSNKIISSTRNEISFVSDEDYYLNCYFLDVSLYLNLLEMNKINLDDYHALYNSIINNLTSNFIQFFYYFVKEDQILKKAHKTKVDEDIIQNAFLESFDTEKFLSAYEKKLDSSVLRTVYYAYKYSETDITEEDYRKIEDLVINNLDKFNVRFKLHCWGHLLEMIILQLIPKDKKYYHNAFRLCDYFVKLNLFPDVSGTPIGLSIFRNAVGIAIMVKEFEWGKNFVEQYSTYLSPEPGENEKNFSMGRLLFHLKKYEESIDFLNKVKYQQVYEKINVRFYYLMNYIELKSYQSAISMLNSIRQFYAESKDIPPMFAVLVESSLKFFREIIRAEENNKKLDYSVLKEAQNAGRYYQKQYILSKIESLVK